jgi:threonine dehydrogenase-like Zn-dependent dehydrogenase
VTHSFQEKGTEDACATVMYGARDVGSENVPDAHLVEPTDALVTVTRGCICGSDLWPYNSMAPSETGNRMGHEFHRAGRGDRRSGNRTVKKGGLVVAPFRVVDGTCEFCRQGLQTSLPSWGCGVRQARWRPGERPSRVPQADGNAGAAAGGPRSRAHALLLTPL